MKTTFRYIFAIASLFAISSVASAQGTGEEPEQKYEGVHTEKSAVYDFTTQKGEVTLESFVEGYIKPAEPKPLDVIFVWDESGAMNASMKTDEGKKNVQYVIGRSVQLFIEQVNSFVSDSRFGLARYSGNVTKTVKLDYTLSESNFPTSAQGNGRAVTDGINWALQEFKDNPRADGKSTPVIVLITGGGGYVNESNISGLKEFKETGYFVSILIDCQKDRDSDVIICKYMSSDYPDAVSTTDTGNPISELAFSLYTATPQGLDNFFTALSKTITSIPDMGPTVMTKDVLSPSFKLPAGTSLSDINAYKVPCTGLVFDESGEVKDYVFADKENWQKLDIDEGAYTEDADKTKVYCNITTDKDGNDQVELTGFDYKTFFCGPVYSDSGSKTDPKGKKYDVVGYKFVITLPIVLASGNAATLTTNTSESGLYAQNGEQVAFFPLPEVYFAYITIVKKGLAENESALFKVSKKTSGGVESEICQVALTGDGKGSVSKGVYAGMFTPGDSYTVAELTDWGWTYNLSSMTLFVGDIEVTDDNKIFEMIADDPSTENVKEGNEGKNAIFTFTNAKKEGITVKNAENAKLNHLITTAVSE